MSVFDFDTEKIDTTSTFEVLPIGTYIVVITLAEKVPTKKGDGELMNLRMQVVDGPFKDRVLFHGFNVKNPNQQCVEISKKGIATMLAAIKTPNPQKFYDMYEKPFQVVVKHESYNGEPKARVKRFEPVGTKPVKKDARDSPYSEPIETPEEDKAPWDE